MDQNDQMDAMFKSSRTDEVDPVSGNEVPTGSLPEEVRDDIPAQLSEGEYVVPADVVRYFGVKFFEDIRTQAKQGFQELDQGGRIGGDPVGMEMGDDELPFDISELQMVDDGAPEQPMMNKGGYVSGYVEGGDVTQMNVPDFLEDYINTGGDDYRTYMSPEGTPMVFRFVDGKPVKPIPEGFVLQSDYVMNEAAPEAPSEKVSTLSDDFEANTPIDIDISKVGTDEEDGGIDRDWSLASLEDFTKGAKSSLLSNKSLGKAAATLGPMGLAANVALKGLDTRKRNNMIKGITDKLAGMTSSDNDWDALKKIETSLLAQRTVANEDSRFGIKEKSGIYGGQSTLTENLKDTDGDGYTRFGDTWLGDMLGFDANGGFGIEEGNAGLGASLGGARRDTTPTGGGSSSSPTPTATTATSSNGNSFMQNLKNTFTPNDGKSFVNGDLKDDD